MKYIKTFEQYSEVNEEGIFDFKKKPLTEQEIENYMNSHRTRRSIWQDASKDPDKKKAWIDYLNANPSHVRKDIVIQNVKYDPKEKKIVKTQPAGTGNWNMA